MDLLLSFNTAGSSFGLLLLLLLLGCCLLMSMFNKLAVPPPGVCGVFNSLQVSRHNTITTIKASLKTI